MKKLLLITITIILSLDAFCQDTLYPLSISLDNLILADSNNITTGKQNTNIGIGAGKNITTGRNNTIAGESAGIGITTLSSNTFIGRKAGELADSTESATIVGKEGGRYGSNNSFSVLVGSNTGQKGNYLRSVVLGTTASYNSNIDHEGLVLIGNWAMAENAYNVDSTTAIGTSVAWHMQSPSKRGVFLGALSGAESGGNDNTYIGFKSGEINQGNGNVFIGYEAGSTETATSNTLIIGNSETDLIRGDFETGIVKIDGNLTRMSRYITATDTLKLYDKKIECYGELTLQLLSLNDLEEGHDEIVVWNVGSDIVSVNPYGSDFINGINTQVIIFPYKSKSFTRGRTSWLMK